MLGRYAVTAVLAVAVTFGLFYGMQAMIDTGKQAVLEPKPTPEITLTRKDRDETVPEKDPVLPDRPDKEDPPEPPDRVTTDIVPPGGDTVAIGFPTGTDSTGPKGLPDHVSDGEILPLLRVPAVYPREALRRGVEGYVVLEFTVTKEGTIADARVVAAEPGGMFNSAALRAIEKYKYKPRIVDGRPRNRPGVQFKMTFELND